MTIADIDKIVKSLSVRAEPYHIRAALICIVDYLKEKESKNES